MSNFAHSNCYRDFSEELLFFQRNLSSVTTNESYKRLKLIPVNNFHALGDEIIKMYGEHLDKVAFEFIKLLNKYLALYNYSQLENEDRVYLKTQLNNDLISIISFAKQALNTKAASLGIFQYNINEHSWALRNYLESKVGTYINMLNIEINKYNAKQKINLSKTNSTRIYIYYLPSHEYYEIKNGLKTFHRSNDSTFIELTDTRNSEILAGLIGVNNNYHTKNGIVNYIYFSDRQGGNSGIFTTDGITFYKIIDFIYTLDDKVQIRLQRINDKVITQEKEITDKKVKGRKNRKHVPMKIRALLQKEVNSKCPFCQSEDVDHFIQHHIDEDPSNNEISNLLLVCPNCHSKIHKEDITKEEVISMKKSLVTYLVKSTKN